MGKKSTVQSVYNDMRLHIIHHDVDVMRKLLEKVYKKKIKPDIFRLTYFNKPLPSPFRPDAFLTFRIWQYDNRVKWIDTMDNRQGDVFDLFKILNRLENESYGTLIKMLYEEIRHWKRMTKKESEEPKRLKSEK